MRKQIRFFGQKRPDILSSFGLITGIAGETEVADPICPSIGFGLDMLHLQRHILSSTVATGSIPFFQEVLPASITELRPLLILHAADLCILDLLDVKLDQLQAQRSARA